MEFGNVLGVRVAATSLAEASEAMLASAEKGEPGYVCATNVHAVMEAHDDPDFKRVLNEATFVVPDGMPVARHLRRQGHPDQIRVPGPHLFVELLKKAEERAIPVGFYGGSQECIDRMVANLKTGYPALDIRYAVSPPYRAPSKEEEEATRAEIDAAGVRLLFIGLGCPKQERWMNTNAPHLRAMMIGVGAAFDRQAGLMNEVPRWAQDHGLEWAVRLIAEPKRLWKRYAKHNPRFVWLSALQTRAGRSV